MNRELYDRKILRHFKKYYGGLPKMPKLDAKIMSPISIVDIVELNFEHIGIKFMNENTDKYNEIGFYQAHNFFRIRKGDTLQVIDINPKYITLEMTNSRTKRQFTMYICKDSIKHLTSDRMKRIKTLDSIIK